QPRWDYNPGKLWCCSGFIVAAASTPIPAAKPAAKSKVLKIAAAPAVSTRKRFFLATKDETASHVLDKCSALVLRVEGLETANSAQQLEIIKLKGRVKKLERLNKVAAASAPILAAKPAAKPKLVKDKGKGILIEDPKPMKKKDQIEMDAEYHGFKKKPQSKFEARKNMISYLKNTEGFKMKFFKGNTYDQILLIFQARFDANMKFLFKSREEMEKEDEEIIKSINETPTQKAAKRRKLSEEAQEADNLRGRLEIVP
nr:hypothetical protein [Tanacetum cinerariifolium]